MERQTKVAFATKNLTSAVKIAEFTPDVPCVLNLRVDLGKTGGLLNGSAATMTLTTKVTRDGAAVPGEYGAYAKQTATDTRMTINVEAPIALEAGQKLEVFASSSNASDSDVDGDVIFTDISAGYFDHGMASQMKQIAQLLSMLHLKS
jgi:hypothetical protein